MLHRCNLFVVYSHDKCTTKEVGRVVNNVKRTLHKLTCFCDNAKKSNSLVCSFCPRPSNVMSYIVYSFHPFVDFVI